MKETRASFIRDSGLTSASSVHAGFRIEEKRFGIALGMVSVKIEGGVPRAAPSPLAPLPEGEEGHTFGLKTIHSGFGIQDSGLKIRRD
jgi:hypothetical protein